MGRNLDTRGLTHGLPISAIGFDRRRRWRRSFLCLARPSPSNDYLSVSSPSSYLPPIITSRSFALSSGNRQPAFSTLFTDVGSSHEDLSNGAFVVCTTPESLPQYIQAQVQDSQRRLGRQRRLAKVARSHKWQVDYPVNLSCDLSGYARLADMVHDLMSLSPSHGTTRYNVIICFWTHAFHKFLEALFLGILSIKKT